MLARRETGLSPPAKKKMTVLRRYFFCGSFVLFMSCVCVFFHIWTKGEVGAPWNRFKPSSFFYWPFQGGTSFVDLLCFLSCGCFAFVCVSLYVPCDHLLGKGWPLGSCLWCLTVSLSLSHWYPGSGVVLDCIDSWSLHPYFVSLGPSVILRICQRQHAMYYLQQNLGRRFSASKMHLSPPPPR